MTNGIIGRGVNLELYLRNLGELLVIEGNELLAARAELVESLHLANAKRCLDIAYAIVVAQDQLLIVSPTSGSYFFEGKQVDKMNENQLTALRKGNLGFIFQSFNLIDELTVCENVELPLIYIGVKANERKERVKKVLEKVNLLHRANHYPQQLSGGQQQRVAIARAVVTDCKLLLADEPTGNLDSVNGIEVMELLSELNAQGTTIIIVTHSQRDAMYAHRVIQLLDGQIVAENVNRPLGKNMSAKNETV